jgi:putative protease
VRKLTDYKVGKVTHFYDKIKVAVVELSADLAVGDKIKFVRGGEEMLTQPVESIQVEHEKIDTAKKGDIVGLKVDGEVKEGAEIYKI